MSALRTHQHRTEMTSPKCEAELISPSSRAATRPIALRMAVKR
jgi:hypothetical protein